MNIWKSIVEWLRKAVAPVRETIHEPTPPWLKIAEGELGTKEIPGSKHNPRILEYHQATTLKATTDEVPWCSSFVNWVMEQAGIDGTRSAAARSWERWGVELDEPQLGAIVVMSRGKNPAQGHVGFFMGFSSDPRLISVLGGNQGNTVSIQTFPVSRVLSYRWPEEL